LSQFGNYKNEKNECFGCKVKFSIVVEKPKPVVVESKPIVIDQPISNNVRSSNEVFESFVYQIQVDELKKEFDLKKFDDQTIKRAARISKGDVYVSFDVLLSNNNEEKK